MKNRKRLLTLALLCMAVVFSVLGLTACGNAASDKTDGNTDTKADNANPLGLSFALTDDDTYSVSVGLATERSVIVIPATYNNKPVTKIANKAFMGCTNLKKVTIPDSVTSIGNSAFMNCSSLTSVIIPDSVTNIYEETFRNCTALISATIPDSVINIDDMVFYCCTSLTNITIGDKVTNIGNGAFYSCTSLTSVTIPDSVTSIGSWAFNYCTSLNMVYITDIAAWCNIKFNDYASNPLLYAHNLYLNGELITNLVIPDSVTSIGNYAFYNCTPLTSVTIGNGVTNIGNRAFSGCCKLVEVINKSIFDITKGAWGNSCIGSYALNIKIDGQSDIVNKNDYLFYTYNGINYLLGYVGNDTNLNLPDNYNGENYQIYKYAFSYCRALTSVTKGKGVTSIGDSAFISCTSLTSVTIPNSVTSIGDYVFGVRNNIQTVFYNGGKEQWDKIENGEGNVNVILMMYFYSEAKPTDSGKYWHYAADGVTPVIW